MKRPTIRDSIKVKEKKALKMKIETYLTQKMRRTDRGGSFLDQKSLMNFKRKKNAKLKSKWPYLRLISLNAWVVCRSLKVKLNLKSVKLTYLSRNSKLAKKSLDKRQTPASRKVDALNYCLKAGGTWLKSKIKE